ncbi:type VII secretion-associated serine protease mycosin, partial [Streptomyces nanshensis]|uniref:type VII secretion-associated serine protease mycosin n=1 Tax=Streptomyces nanshensis TaxID=518642 RepID=UPI00114CACA3
MRLRRALHLAGTGALTGALLLGSAPTAFADDIRDRQWALPAFDASKIWDKSTGKGVTVAVVDSGVDASHPDLKGQVLSGKDFTKEGGSAQEDTDGHGTSMAGLIAGAGHGPGASAGVMGLAPGAKILPIRFKHDDGELGASWADGVRYAVDHGADVINISIVTSKSTLDQRAIEYAIKHDVVVVAGSGNEGRREKNYPAGYPGVVSVGGVDDRGAVWAKSSWGSNTTLVAPATKNVGADTTSASGYAMTSGTSDATAYVSASAALVRAKHPDLSAGQVINRLIKTAKVPGPEEARNPKLPDEKFGYGVVRPFRAVTYDIPAGSKAGPLAKPEKSSDSAAGEASSSSGSSSDDDSSGWMFALGPPIVLFGLIFLVLVGIAVV